LVGGDHFSAPSEDSALYDLSENREENKLCSSLDFLKTRTSFSGNMASSSSLLPLSLSLWVDGNHFSTPSEDSALRPFRKLRGEQNLFFSRFSEDAINARAARQRKQDQMMKALRQGRRRRTGRENVYLWQRRPHPPQRLQCHPHLFEKELLAVDRETIDKEVNAGGLRASLNAGMTLVRRWIRSRSATHLLHGTTHS
jgi:hypothetical protein